MSINPLKAAQTIASNYQSYLSTTFRLQDQALQEQFLAKLSDTGRFIKGPLLEVTPAFKTGASIADLIKEGILSAEFASLGSELLPQNRQLYWHQEQAIRKLVSQGRNIVVCTGTGSGKTETFLIPILNHLLREKEQGTLGPGVRALLLYPMNALANDQLKRLRQLLQNYPDITFGRYTGETETKQAEAREKYCKIYQREPLPNELIAREQMWRTPPHILLTNYAMLEYLLLRPQDNVFFDGALARYWRFLVIDEAHIYSGAKGIEIAMLLRRLKDRVVSGEQGKLQCIATSATLGSGRDNKQQIVDFARQLFGEDFVWDEEDISQRDVVEAVRLPLVESYRTWGKPAPGLYGEWEALINQNLALEELIQKMIRTGREAGIPGPELDRAAAAGRKDGWQAFLQEILAGDAYLLRLQQELQEKPRLLQELPGLLGLDTPAALETVVSLVNLASQARPDKDSQALLPARFHFFVRALEGAYLSLWPEKRLYLARREYVTVLGQECRVFEIAVCRQCGALYLVGCREKNDTRQVLKNVAGEKAKAEYYLLLEQNAPLAEWDEDEEVENLIPVDWKSNETYQLCLRCGTIDQANIVRFPCSCGENWRANLQNVRTGENGKVTFCPACGKRSSHGLVWRFIVGTDAAASVLSSALYQEIEPPRETRERELPAEEADEWVCEIDVDHYGGVIAQTGNERGKLLVFSDSRQDAAFFAPYLQRTYHQILWRRLIVKTLQENARAAKDNAWYIQDLVEPLLRNAQAAGLFKAESRQERIKIVWQWLLAELMALDKRKSLEGTGLLGFWLVEPEHPYPLRILPEGKWNLTRQEVISLFRVLLDSIRTRGAIAFPELVSPADEFFKPRNRELFFRFRTPQTKKGIFSWYSTRLNSRLDYLLRLAQKLGTSISEQECRQALASIWEEVLDSKKYTWKNLFLIKNMKNEGTVYQLKHNIWQIKSTLIDPDTPWYICNKCKNITLHNVRGICPVYRCTGQLQACRPQDIYQHDHYYRLYLQAKPMGMRVEEHTAQLTPEAAADLQNDFLQDRVNVLSCSTTFELGVDVGELEAVFMRNVPPTAANYIQRAGRAGRRTSTTAFVLTYAQMRSHDLDHFREPERMVMGKIRAPYFKLENLKIILRHVYATALAAFWKKYPAFFGRVEDFFFRTTDIAPDGPRCLAEFLHSRPLDLQNSLRNIVPEKLQAEVDINNWQWLNNLFSDQGLVTRAAEEIHHDIVELEKLRDQLYQKERKVDHITRLIKTLKEKDLIGFLSNHNIIPKYGFPVDVVELQIPHHGEMASRLQLERDLRVALSEYAPSSQIVAGGKLWTGRYIKRLPGREWESFYYYLCDHCFHYHSERAELAQRTNICKVCENKLGKHQGTFIIPSFGFMADRQPPGNPGEEKPPKTYTTRVCFSGKTADEQDAVQIILTGGVTMELVAAARGRLAVINHAGLQGFQVCPQCGYAILGNERPEKSHTTVWGNTCKGSLKRVSLGHEFETDILKIYVHNHRDQRNAFWLSLLYALLEGASSALQIERQDLDGCLYPTPDSQMTGPAMILFDDVPGGAGHVLHLARPKTFREVLEVTLHRLQQCECGGEEGNSSCYGCLRNYRNQFCHDILNRGMVIEFLKSTLT